jgi:hypothetical protein
MLHQNNSRIWACVKAIVNEDLTFKDCTDILHVLLASKKVDILTRKRAQAIPWFVILIVPRRSKVDGLPTYQYEIRGLFAQAQQNFSDFYRPKLFFTH